MEATKELVFEQDGQTYTCSVRAGGSLRIDSCSSQAATLEIPSELDGRPVAELGQASFAELPNARVIICPAKVKSIGKAAFRDCSRLERVVLPFELQEFREMWFEGCSSLHEMTALGCTGVMSLNSIRGVHIDKVRVGAEVQDIKIPRVPDAFFQSVSVDASNPWISSDGICLYSASGEVLIKCICTVSRYEVMAGCRAIAPEAFAYNKTIDEVILPEGIVEIGESAFESSTLKSLSAPGSLRKIGKAAFSNCRQLQHVELAEGLERIERHAFKGCAALRGFRVPATVSSLEASAFEGCALAGADAVRVVAGNPVYFIDSHGVLYERGQTGLTLLAAASGIAGEYAVRAGTRKIATRAFSNTTQLSSVKLPEGLVSIGKNGFSSCRALKKANLPSTLRSLGERAFYDTALESLVIPASVEDIGKEALCTDFEHVLPARHRTASEMWYRSIVRGVGAPGQSGGQTAKTSGRCCTVRVDDSNRRYCTVSDIVCERLETGGLRGLWYAGNGETAIVPRQITSLAPNAIANARAVQSLWLHDGLKAEGRHAIHIIHPLESIHIVSASGADDCILHPAPTSMGCWSQAHAFEFENLDLMLLAHDCDEMLLRHPPGFEKFWRVVDRLAHPRLMEAGFKRFAEEKLREHLEEIVAEFAQRDYLLGVHQLVDTGVLDSANIARAVETACSADGVAVTAYLLQARSSLGSDGPQGFDDFDI